MSQRTILIVDDDPDLLVALPEALRTRMNGLAVETVDSAAAALERIASSDFDAIVADIKLPGMNGLELLAQIRGRHPDIPTLMITGHGETDLAVSALRGGASDFIRKPIDREYLVASLRRAIETHEQNRRARETQSGLERHVCELEARVEERSQRLKEKRQSSGQSLGWMEAATGPMAKAVQQIRQVAASPLSVLIEGETGTGKELAARAIHQLSARRDQPFVAVDCGAIPETLIESELFGYEKGAFTGAQQRKEGLFQLAGGGTLFLDEIANIPLPLQAKLLRALQQKQIQPLGSKQAVPVAVRIIAASNVPLDEEVRAGRFRPDVFYRLNEFVITLPPLRERDNLLQLANSLLAEAAIELDRPCHRISQAAAQVLLRHHWPGNVRELRNVIRRACLLAQEVIEPQHLAILPSLCSTPGIATGNGLGGLPARGSSLKEVAELAAEEAEGQAIRLALQATAGNKSEAARLLHVDFKTLHLKMKRFGIQAAAFRQTLPEHAH